MFELANELAKSPANSEKLLHEYDTNLAIIKQGLEFMAKENLRHDQISYSEETKGFVKK